MKRLTLYLLRKYFPGHVLIDVRDTKIAKAQVMEKIKGYHLRRTHSGKKNVLTPATS